MRNVIGLVVCGLCIYWAADWAANRESGTASGSGGVAPTSEVAKPTSKRTAPRFAPLIKLGGRLGRRRQYDLWLITNLALLLNSRSREMALLSYCLTVVRGAEQSLDSDPSTEYTLLPDGTVSIATSPKTSEQQFRDSQRWQFEFEHGGGPVVQDCAGSLEWFGTWHDQPGPKKEKVLEALAKARADLESIDKGLDPRLVEVLPTPPTVAVAPNAELWESLSRPLVRDFGPR